MRIEGKLVIDEQEMEDFLLYRCTREEAQALCDHFLSCDDCNQRLEFNRFFLDTLQSTLGAGRRPVTPIFAATKLPQQDLQPREPAVICGSSYYFCPQGLSWLQTLTTTTERERMAAARTLGVFSDVAQRALKVASNPESTHRQLTAVVESDPVLAAFMIRFANSPLFGAAKSIPTPAHAISFVGVEATRQLVLGTVLRKWIGTDREEWGHAVAAAQYAEAAAAHTGRLDPSLAFLAGLVHDIGRLIFQHLPAEKAQIVQTSQHRGCPLGHAEALLLGCNHSDAGAAYLKTCGFPEEIIEAVRFHHRPDLTNDPLAKALFLAEYATGSAEEAVYDELVDAACEPLGISLEEVDHLRCKPWGSLLLAA